jgi:lipoate-protein ligase A
MQPEVMTSIKELLGTSPGMEDVKEALIKEFETEFGLKLSQFPQDRWKAIAESVNL